MGAYMIPQIGAGVWVEFEQGNPDYPIWSGCWYGSAAEVPALALAGNPVSPNIVLQTGLQNSSGDQRSAWSNRRHHAQEHDRRNPDRQRHRDLHSERQGRDADHGWANVTINNGAFTVI